MFKTLSDLKRKSGITFSLKLLKGLISLPAVVTKAKQGNRRGEKSLTHFTITSLFLT